MPAIKKLGQLFKSDKDKDKEKNKDKRSGSDGVGGGIGRLGVENVLRKEYPRHSTNRRTEEDEDVLEDRYVICKATMRQSGNGGAKETREVGHFEVACTD